MYRATRETGEDVRVRRRCAGSVLLVTLLVVSLLMVVVLSLTVWVRMELRSTAGQLHLEEARANARMALMLAIGELQAAAGPDQRTTATADLAARNLAGDRLAAGNAPANNDPLNLGGGGRGLTAVAEGTRFWTGVWENLDSPEDLYFQPPAPRLLQWLVSGNHAQITFEPNLSPNWSSLQQMRLSLGGDLEGVVLVGGGSAGTEPQSQTVLENFGAGPADQETPRDRWVVAPLISLAPGTGTGGRFAYWVGDEGVKARYNLIDPPQTTDAVRARIAHRVAAEMATAAEESQPANTPLTTPLTNVPAFAYDDYPFSGNRSDVDVAHLAHIASNAQKELLRTPALAGIHPERLQKRFHALTLHSRGVLSDSRSGGLKQDLSLAFETPVVFQQMFTGNPALILPGNVSPDTGPVWETVRDFYAFAQRPSVTIDLDSVTPGPHSPAPVMMELRFLFKFSPNDTTNTWHLHTNLAVGFANPYTVPLSTSGLTLAFDQVGKDYLSNTYYDFGQHGTPPWGEWWVWVLENGVRRASFKVLNRANSSKTTGAEWTLDHPNTEFTIPATTWAPGEFKMFSLTDRNQTVTSAGGTIHLHEISNAPLPGNHFTYNTGTALPVVPGPPPPAAIDYVGWKTFHPNILAQIPSRVPTGIAVSLYQSSAAEPLSRVDITSFFTSWPSVPPTAPTPDVDPTLIIAGGNTFQMRLPLEYSYHDWTGDKHTREAYAFRPLADHNLRARHILPAPFQTSNTEFWTFFPYMGERRPPNPVHFSEGPIGGWRWGGRYRDAGGISTSWPRFTPFDLPRRRSQGEPPLLSLGELQHIDLTANDDARSIGYQAGNAFGNSFHAPLLNRDRAIQTRVANAYSPGRQMRFFDISYLLNTAVFDRYFFSSHPGGSLPNSLPNTRYTITDRNGFLTSESGETPGTSPARSLIVEGGFNVNSSNPEAWAAVLASTLRVPVDSDALEIGTPFPRSINQPDGADRAHLGDDQDSYSGYRRLTDAEVRRLAQEMVRQVRQRGPFLSMAQFVNRTLVPADASGTNPLLPPASMGLTGPLQAAIDAAGLNRMPALVGNSNHYVKRAVGDRGLNNPFFPDYDIDFPAIPANPSAANPPPHGSRVAGIPGYLTQADILQVLAPTLTTRSDTFRIRAYGETTGPDDQSLARVWCEAIVQRRPDYVDDAANRPGAPPDQLSSTNAAFGRKFEVIGFRWLHEDEI